MIAGERCGYVMIAGDTIVNIGEVGAVISNSYASLMESHPLRQYSKGFVIITIISPFFIALRMRCRFVAF